MSPYGNSRNRYVNDSIATASPSKLLTMLYDRLVLDMLRAEEALQQGSRGRANECLIHAQAIVLELRTTLKVDAWEGGPALASIYMFIHGELIAANMAGDAGRVAVVRALVEPLREAWHEAAVLAVGAGSTGMVGKVDKVGKVGMVATPA